MIVEIIFDKVRQLWLGKGDVVAIQKYFLKLQAENSGFFCSMDLDDGGRLMNLFWNLVKSLLLTLHT